MFSYWLLRISVETGSGNHTSCRSRRLRECECAVFIMYFAYFALLSYALVIFDNCRNSCVAFQPFLRRRYFLFSVENVTVLYRAPVVFVTCMLFICSVVVQRISLLFMSLIVKEIFFGMFKLVVHEKNHD